MKYTLKTILKPVAATGLVALVSGCVTFTGDNGIWTVATSPARPSQWKNHPYRTGIVSAVYVGAIVAAASSGGGSDSSTSDDGSGSGSTGSGSGSSGASGASGSSGSGGAGAASSGSGSW